MSSHRNRPNSDVADRSSQAFDQLSRWAARTFPADGDAPHLQGLLVEGAIQLERAVQDAENSSISSAVRGRIQLWLSIAETSEIGLPKSGFAALIIWELLQLRAWVRGWDLEAYERLLPKTPFTLLLADPAREDLGEPSSIVGGLNEVERDALYRDLIEVGNFGHFLGEAITQRAVDFEEIPSLVDSLPLRPPNGVRRNAFHPIYHSFRHLERAPERERVAEHALHTWSIEIILPQANVSASVFGGVIWHIATALESIEGVICEVEDLRLGSAYVRIRVVISNFIRRNEVKKILEHARKLAVAALAKPIAESRQQLADANKLDAERSKLEAETRLLPTPQQAAESVELDLRLKRATALQAELDVAIKASEIVAKGLIQADNVEFRINDYTFLRIEDGTPITGATLDEIEEGEEPR